MAKETRRQQEIVGRVMHEFKHGELETRGRKVRNPRQAIAIGLSEAGASRNQSAKQNTRSRRRTEDKERKGQTAQQQKEGRGSLAQSRGAAKSRAGAARGAGKASRTAASSKSGAAPRGRSARGGPTRAQLYAETQRRGMHGCSRMSKSELEQALHKR